MRVAMVTAFPAVPEAPEGGVEAVAACLAPALMAVRPGLELHVVRCPGRPDGAARREGDPPFTVHEISGGATARDLLPGLGPQAKIRRLLEALRPDVVHVQEAPHLVDARRYRSVLTVHGIQERTVLFRGRRLRGLRSRFLGWRIGRPRSRYRDIIAIAGYVARRLGGRVKGRFHFVPNPVEAGFFTTRRREAGPRILFQGRLIPRKNVHGLIEAVRLLVEGGTACTLRLAGPEADRGYVAALRMRAHQAGLSEAVAFLGNLDREALREEMAAARCLALASFEETAPMAVAEAAAMGLPSVASPAGGAAEMVAHGFSGFLVDPHSAASIADGLRPLLESAEPAETFGERARARAEVHRPDRVARRTLELYDRIVAESPA